ncbi:MAG: VOC family protein [Thermoplasmatota archaeon]
MATIQRPSHITVIVKDQDAAKAFYTEAFQLAVTADDIFDMGGDTMRWLTVGPEDGAWGIAITLPMAMPGRDPPPIGDANMTVLLTDDVDGVCKQVEAAGGTVDSPPEDLPWGRSAVVRDLDGNPWNLVKEN